MELEDLKRKISKDIVDSQIRIDCVYYVLKDIFREISDTYNQYLVAEEKEQEAAAQKGEEENGDGR